jgi:drug/metabolite transporter (DMT)-like permease
LFVGVGTIWGASFLFIAIGLDHFHPGLITWVRIGLGAGILAVLPAARASIRGHKADSRVRRLSILSAVARAQYARL